MKKLNIILCAATAAMLAFACSKSEQVNTPDEKDNNTETPVDVINPDGTRTITVKITQPVTESLWEDGEGFNWGTEGNASFGIFTDNNDNLNSTSVAKSGTDISITATVDAQAKKAVFYYPAGIAYSMVTSTTAPNTYFRFENMANQVQTTAGSMNFDVEDADGNMGLVSSAVLDLTATSSPFEVTMTPIVALVRFIVYSSTGSSASVKSITLTADSATNHLNGQENITFNFSTGALSSFCSAAGTLSNKVTLTNAFSLSGITSASQSSGIYMTTQPTVITGYTISIKMEDNSLYEFHTAAGMTLAAGKIKNIPINLDNATDSPFTPGLSVDRILFNEASDATSTDITLTGKNIGWTATPSAGVTLSSSSGSFTTENSTVITASYSANTSAEQVEHTVTFSNDEGLPNIVVTIRQAAAGASDPTYTYSFSGWQDGNTSFSRSAGPSETSTPDWMIVFSQIRDDETGNAPSNDDGWKVIKYGFQLTSSELTALKSFAKFSFDFTDGESKIWFQGFKENAGEKRVFDKWFKMSDLSSDYVHVMFTQGKYYAPGVNYWPDLEVSTSASYYGPGGEAQAFPVIATGASNSSYSFTIPTACNGRWQCQLMLDTDLPALDTGKTYDFSATINCSNTNVVRIQLMKAGVGYPVDDDFNVNEANTNKVFNKQFTGVALVDARLIFDFGYAPAGTDVTISNIIIAEHTD